jgi:hypothetical protein
MAMTLHEALHGPAIFRQDEQEADVLTGERLVQRLDGCESRTHGAHHVAHMCITPVSVT